MPTMEGHLQKTRLAEELGFSALWVRDVPMHVPTFGDAGQTYDPFTYLGFLAGQTQRIALGAASIALPLRHPVHIAKSAATIDQLSGGRLLLGIASGDRYEEYPATATDYQNRGAAFRAAYAYLRHAQQDFPILEDNIFGVMDGKMDVLPKPYGSKLPLLITGHSQQDTAWVASNGDGWMYYPRNLYMQEHNIKEWRALIPEELEYTKPFMQPLYVDLQEQDDFKPVGIHLGIRAGMSYLIDYFHQLHSIGVNHIAINMRFNTGNIELTMEKLATRLLAVFHTD